MDENIKNNTSLENNDFYVKKIRAAKDIGSVKNLIKEQSDFQKNKGIENKDAINTISVIEKVENCLGEIQKVFDEKDEVKKQEYLIDLNKKRKDPFEGIETIEDRAIRNKLVGLLLGKNIVKDYFSTVFNLKSIPLIMETWGDINKETTDPEIKKNTGEFVKAYNKGVNDVDNKESIIETLIQESKKTKESLDARVNLSKLFDSEAGLKDSLKEEIKVNILDKTNLEYIENEDHQEEKEEKEGQEDEEEEDYIEKKYALITKFYNDYLSKDDNIYMKKEDAYDLWNECNDFLQIDNNINECPALLKLTDFLKAQSQKPQEKPQEKRDDDFLPDLNIDDSIEKPITSDDKDKKGESNTWSGLKSMMILGGVNFAFVTLSHFIFSPVSAAIWLSKQRLNDKGKFDTRGWKEPFQIGSIVKDEKDEKGKK
jgi:hypothetical protein